MKPLKILNHENQTYFYLTFIENWTKAKYFEVTTLMYFPPLANDYMVRYTFLTRVFSWDLIISFLFHSSSNFHNILMIRSSFQLKDCSEKSNQILEITITYVKVKKRFQRKMWKIIIHFRYLCWCVFWRFIICQIS